MIRTVGPRAHSQAGNRILAIDDFEVPGGIEKIRSSSHGRPAKTLSAAPDELREGSAADSRRYLISRHRKWRGP
jgi:hypothetical protein